ncbi:M20 family metallopeptidase [Oscillospiraceae bacterium PP1C4]
MIKEYRELAEAFLKDLVAIETVNPPGREARAALYVAQTLMRYDIETEVQTVAEGRANVIAAIGDSENLVILNGHLDVVPAGDGWDTDPFQPIVRDGRLYGRGSCDMKAGLAAMMATAIRVKQENLLGNCRLVLAFTADEEVNGLGSKHFIKHFHFGKKNLVVIGEPTENQINIAHRGVVRLRVRATGRQCHSGQPQNGINAIGGLSHIIMELEKLHQERTQIKHPILPSPTMCCTMIQGGAKDNVIPGECECVLDCRTIPGDTAEKLRAQVLERISAMRGLDPEIQVEVTPFIEVLPGMAEPDSRVVQIARAAYHAAFGREPVLADFPACCDMSCFTAHGLETVLCGPGSIQQAHTANEYVVLDQLQDAIEFYTNLILQAGD